MSDPTTVSLDPETVTRLQQIRQQVQESTSPERAMEEVRARLVESLAGSEVDGPDSTTVDAESAERLADLVIRLIGSMEEAEARGRVIPARAEPADSSDDTWLEG